MFCVIEETCLCIAHEGCCCFGPLCCLSTLWAPLQGRVLSLRQGDRSWYSSKEKEPQCIQTLGTKQTAGPQLHSLRLLNQLAVVFWDHTHHGEVKPWVALFPSSCSQVVGVTSVGDLCQLNFIL